MHKKLFKILIPAIVIASIQIEALESRLSYDSHSALEMTDSSILTLEDGSTWQIFGVEQEALNEWYDHHTLAPITITPNYLWKGGYNGYLLKYQDTESQVTAQLVGAPIQENPQAITIIGIDKNAHSNRFKSFYHGCVYLSNGTFWLVSMFDTEVIENWQAGDLVIIGKEGGSFPYSSHILINTNTGRFVRAEHP